MLLHEVCQIFPMMSPDEFEGLKADIAAHGQREPVWTYRGKLIDGRNRLKACEALGLTPKVREWSGNGSLVEFIVSLNLHRRHLNSGQRAMCSGEAKERIAQEIAEEEAVRKSKKPAPVEIAPVQLEATFQFVEKSSPLPSKAIPRDATKEAAKLFGTNTQYVADAIAIKAKAPALAEKVKSGEITLPQAKREVVRVEKRAELEAKAAAVEADPEAEAPTWEIIEGDCVEHLAGIERGSIRLIFADPPYNIGIDYGDHHDDSMDAEDFMEWSEEWIRAAAATLAPDGSMWVLINDEWADVFGCLLRDCGLHRRAWIKWFESFGVNNSNNFNRCSRHLFYMVKDPRRFVFNADAVSRPSDRQAIYGDKRADPGGKVWDDVWGINPSIPRLVGNAAERIPDFPTQLPLQLLRAVVGCASDPGDLVLDPFNGSGTTGAACVELGRRYVGIEKSAEFARIARMRLKTITTKETAHAFTR